ncbi:Hypp6509 [Branchiostoma lanceolatum]|uniref:Hypp6509 protein n=1 Tax=Branchiostoma lanceolatum TaxID=7740 RepID=A0A8J9YUZ5_BRALA|nr:Hypp6509 [Branchiostoma lanceolatum]
MGGDAKTPKRSKTPTTKAWNVNLSHLPPDESLYSDYEDQGKSRLCSVKLRSNQLDKWIGVHKDAFDESFERTKQTTVEWKSSAGTTCVLIQTGPTATRKSGKSLLSRSVHFYHKKRGLLVQGQYKKWCMEMLYPELVNIINAQVDMQTRSTIKGSAQRDAINSFPFEPISPKQALTTEVCETPTVPKCTNPRNLQDLEAPISDEIKEEVQVVFENGAKHNNDTAIKDGDNSKVKIKPADSNNAAFDELQKQFVGFVQNFNSLKDDLISKDKERDEAHAQTLKHLTAQLESKQKSLEDHLRKTISKLNNDLSKAQRDIVLQRERQAEEAAIVRGLWEGRVRGMSSKVDSLSASNADLQDIIKRQDSVINVLTERSKEAEYMLGSLHCNTTTAKTAVLPTVPPQHNNRTAANSHDARLYTTTTMKTTLPPTVPPQHDKRAATNSHDTTNSHDDTTSQDNEVTTANQQNNESTTARYRKASFEKHHTNTRPAVGPNNTHNNDVQVRIFADSLFRDVDTDRAFQGKSAKLHRNTTITAATGNIRNISDPTTETVILHVGSNDLDNSKYHQDSVRGTVQKTRELLEATRRSFPNVQVAVSQVLQRGPNQTSVLNKNIRDYNQEILNVSKTSDFTYIKHKKLSQARNLYLHDQIHLDPRSGTKHLVADVKHTLAAPSRPGTGPHLQQTPMASPQHRDYTLNRHVPQRFQPDLPRRDNFGPARGWNQPTFSRVNNPAPTRGETNARNKAGGTLQITKPTTLPTPALHIGTLKQFKKNIRKAWNILTS